MVHILCIMLLLRSLACKYFIDSSHPLPLLDSNSVETTGSLTERASNRVCLPGPAAQAPGGSSTSTNIKEKV